MKKKQLPFEVCHCGKCNNCGLEKYLDSMVRVEYKKGLYECIDCKVNKESHTFKYYTSKLKNAVFGNRIRKEELIVKVENPFLDKAKKCVRAVLG